MANTFASLAEKKFVGDNGVKLLYKATLALLESAVDTIEEALESKASLQSFHVTIPTSGWVLTDGLYHVTITVQGLLSTDEGGGIGPIQTGTTATDKAMLAAWRKVTRCVSSDNALTLYASAVPNVSIPILIEVFR